MTKPKLDLVFERVVDVPPDAVFAAWTKPELVVKWFTPAPWKTVQCEIDLRPGGIFRTVMQSPEGQDFPNVGCWLEIVPNRRLAWTDVLEAGWRPAREAPGLHCPFHFTAILDFHPHGNGGTRYLATVLHPDETSRIKHEEMGFHDGWGKACEQLVELVKRTRV